VQLLGVTQLLKEQLAGSSLSPEGRGQKERELAIYNTQYELLSTDIKMLQEYIKEDRVTDEDGTVVEAHLETAFSSIHDPEETISRPVIRLRREDEEFDTIFTRVDPKNTTTSMIIRIRVGWEQLKAVLLEPVDRSKGSPARWDAYICTAAERPYALEVRASICSQVEITVQTGGDSLDSDQELVMNELQQ
jgi:hypothetical protein